MPRFLISTEDTVAAMQEASTRETSLLPVFDFNLRTIDARKVMSYLYAYVTEFQSELQFFKRYIALNSFC